MLAHCPGMTVLQALPTARPTDTMCINPSRNGNPTEDYMGTTITLKRPDGKDASGYLANAARGNAPGVVVIQEWWGLQDQIKGMCDRFARAGFDALAPDLYKGTVVPYHDTDAAGKA